MDSLTFVPLLKETIEEAGIDPDDLAEAILCFMEEAEFFSKNSPDLELTMQVEDLKSFFKIFTGVWWSDYSR